jgi:hypothetical protein
VHLKRRKTVIKKLLFVFLGLLYFSGYAFASFGFSVRGGKLFGSSSFDKNDEHKYYIVDGSHDYEFNFINYGADVFFEKRVNNETFGFYGYGYIGVKAGYTKYSESYYEINTTYFGDYNDFKVTSNAYAIPIMAYYKYEYEDNERIRVWGGLGAVLLYNEFKCKGTGSAFGTPPKTESSSAIMPALELGTEYAFTRTLSAFLTLGYQFNGKMTASFDSPLLDETSVDFSGITFNLGVSFNLIKERD